MAERSTVDNTAQGWGFAAVIVLLAIICAASAWWIHNETYCEARHPLCGATSEVIEGGH